MRYVNLALLLAAFWALNSGHFTPLLIGSGVVCIGLVLWLAVRLGTRGQQTDPLPFVIRGFTYVPWLVWQIVVSNIEVAKLVWSPRPKIDPQLFTIPCSLRSDLGITIYANSITLTPGTVTVDVAPGMLLIHSLTASSKRDLLTGAMEAQVARLEGPG